MLAACLASPMAAEFSHTELAFTLTPAASGQQLVRCSLPLPKGMLPEGDTLAASDGNRRFQAAVRVLTEGVHRFPGNAALHYDLPVSSPRAKFLRFAVPIPS